MGEEHNPIPLNQLELLTLNVAVSLVLLCPLSPCCP